MTKKKNGLAMKFWGAYGYFYDGLIYLYPYQELIHKVASKVKIRSSTRILDLGCGTGNLAVELLKENPSLSVIGVDWSRPMLSRAQKKLNGYKNVVLAKEKVEDYLKHAPNNQSTDIVMVNVVYTISDRLLLWSLIYKNLEPGGNLIFANPDRAGNSSILKEHIEHSSWFSLLRPRLVGIWVFDSLLSLLGISGSYDFTHKEQLYNELETAGFKVHKNLTERCYGGSESGIDLIVIASKPEVMV